MNKMTTSHYNRYLPIFMLLALTSCNQEKPATTTQESESEEVRGAYFGESVGNTATMFAEGIISKEYQELNSVFSPDGNEFYYTLSNAPRSFYTIMQYKKDDNGVWDGPEVASFSGQYADADPYITSDGTKLYYISRRPKEPGAASSGDFDIWMVRRVGEGWGAPERLGGDINTDGNEYYVSATDDGSIYFSSSREGGLGFGDIYESKLVNGSYVSTPLSDAINSPMGEGDPYVSPDNQMIIFFSGGREDDLGRGDLYISFKKDGQWQKAQNMGSEINSSSFEYCPMMSPDGKYFFWTSYQSSDFESSKRYTASSYIDRLESADNGMGNVYWISAEVLEQFR